MRPIAHSDPSVFWSYSSSTCSIVNLELFVTKNPHNIPSCDASQLEHSCNQWDIRRPEILANSGNFLFTYVFSHATYDIFPTYNRRVTQPCGPERQLTRLNSIF